MPDATHSQHPTPRNEGRKWCLQNPPFCRHISEANFPTYGGITVPLSTLVHHSHVVLVCSFPFLFRCTMVLLRHLCAGPISSKLAVAKRP